ncbi:ORF 3b [Betacoronavirus Erinaceus/VMC/DEU/2012]|uniref:ORF 3b n=2 Tax=Betacoronavirus Erinaceus/VMC/DEU/2012 TaxID=1385427 RepID=U5LNJ3_9BETC|nr:ORF3b [Betacoronavirus Erinaceus/VMC/DEU/2012]AGX27801.1 ORF 3b [Betacoronavirus Erinaceus/VMC/DEU/2012]
MKVPCSMHVFKMLLAQQLAHTLTLNCLTQCLIMMVLLTMMPHKTAMLHLVMSIVSFTNLMNPVSLLNQFWQSYNSVINTAEDWVGPPQYSFYPVLNTVSNIQWFCTATFLGYTVQTLDNTKALAKQKAAQQLLQKLNDGL